MDLNKRLNLIRDYLKNNYAPKKRNLANKLGISLGTLNKYLAILKKCGDISYLRSKDEPNFIGKTYVIYKGK